MRERERFGEEEEEEILQREALNWLDRKEGLRLRQRETPSALVIEAPTAVREPSLRCCRPPLQRLSFLSASANVQPNTSVFSRNTL